VNAKEEKSTAPKGPMVAYLPCRARHGTRGGECYVHTLN